MEVIVQTYPQACIGLKEAMAIALVLVFLNGVVDAQATRKVALVVGVSNYDKSGFRQLQYAHRDATALSALLRTHGFEVTTLIQEQLTKQNFDQHFEQLTKTAKQLSKADVLLLFFSGHGVQRNVIESTPQGSQKVEAPFFCPHDSLQSDTSSMIALNGVLKTVTDNSGSENNIIIVDACRDNTEKGLDGTTILNLPYNTSVLWACSPGQKSHEAPKIEQGILTHYLMKGMQGAAANARGHVDWLTLAAYVRNEVEHNAPLLLDDTQIVQKPNLVGNHLDSPILRLATFELPPLMKSPFSKDEAARAQAAWSKSLSIDKTFRNYVGMEFAIIPPGEFIMGTPPSQELPNQNRRQDEHAHTVRLTRPFYCGVTEVTQEQWMAVMKSSPWKEETLLELREGASYPAVMITWKGARQYCDVLSKSEGKVYRLPTEAEWEYACRAGTQSVFHSPAPAMFDQFAWFKSNTWDAEKKFPQPVGQKASNHFGLFDLHGNVGEYCEDFYSESYYEVSPAENPTGANVGDKHVVRGGSFAHDLSDCRSARRLKPLRQRDCTIGFRVVIEISW